MKWLNGVGKLKITHRARVQFLVGSYVDKVVCDVVPMQACHLLLGRPWQFDHDATHHGRSNKYSFMHQGVNHILEPMVDQVLKVEQFPQVKKPKKNTSKPRTVLFQGGGDDVSTTAFAKIDPSTNSNILMVGTTALQIPSPEAEPDEVTPMFRTPCVAQEVPY